MQGLRTFSYGGGVQSTAALVLAATGRIDFPIFLFANVGDDSEDPATLEYVEQYAKPYAALHGIQLHELHRARRDGTRETLYTKLHREGSRSVEIPVRMANGAPGNRTCTAQFKIQVVGKWLRQHGASTDNPAVVGIGISLDEVWRVNQRKAQPYERPVYPLLDQNPPMRRDDCARIIRLAGLPIPPKSACWFCPMKRLATWAEERRDRPEQFAAACDLEERINRTRREIGKDPVYLTRHGRPLAEAVVMAQDELTGTEDDAECDNSSCFT
ncbi:phosphoadenosine phosphosulfate reductase [Micromonospora sp. S-DT3-3-22]|uniref:phosphoadenosine phosphosulfate reductase n=1 Tax=Micromonospora sp. S-DT3-3-22 TaxID=2755359 RepID=UPI0028162260|nr:phosphoadenosine phosphosulfate reductase [Micromonospora sp. S-DT3-3-22]